MSRIVHSSLPPVEIPDLSVTDYAFRTAPDDADGTDVLDANRAHAVDIAVTITRALERGSGEA